jgi:hypothetical protein
MNTSTSRFMVGMDSIVAACDRAVDAVKAERNRLFEKEIAHQMRPRRWGKVPSREKAEAMARGSYSGQWMTPPWENMWWGELERAERLLMAAKASGRAEAMLDSNDAAFVGKWTEKEKK